MGSDDMVALIADDAGRHNMGHAPAPRLHSLTSLRWFAATAVFLHHAHAGLGLSRQGATGVSFFFVLSGFVLSWASTGPMESRAFYWRRFARVWPAFIVTSSIAIGIYVAIGGIRSRSDLVAAVFSLTLLQSWVPSQQINFGGNGVSWSLSDEVFFYAVFPLLFVPAARRRDRGLEVLGVLVALTAVAVPFLVRPTSATSLGYWFTYINPMVRVLEFLLGAILGILVQRGALPRIPVGPAAALAAAAYLLAGHVPDVVPGPLTLVPFAVLVTAAAQADQAGTTPRLLALRPLIALGTWSFAFYLVHQVIVDVYVWLEVPLPLRVVAGYVTATGAAYLVYRLVEHPWERRIRARMATGRPPGVRAATPAPAADPWTQGAGA